MTEPFDPKKVIDAVVAAFMERLKADPRYAACRSYDEIAELGHTKLMEEVREIEASGA